MGEENCESVAGVTVHETTPSSRREGVSSLDIFASHPAITLRAVMEEVHKHGILRQDLIEEASKSLNTATELCTRDVEAESCEQRTADLRVCLPALATLSALVTQLESPRNFFTNIHLGDFTLLCLLSPHKPATCKAVYSGASSCQYIHVYGPVEGATRPIASVPGHATEDLMQELTENFLSDSVPRFLKRGYRLERQSTNIFRNVHLKEREISLVLSCTEPIVVENVQGEEGSVFIAGQVSKSIIERIAKALHVEFDADQPDGIFQTVHHSAR